MNRSILETANYLEAGLWIVIGLIFAGSSAVRRGPQRRMCLVAAAVFCVFGVTDIIEPKPARGGGRCGCWFSRAYASQRCSGCWRRT